MARGKIPAAVSRERDRRIIELKGIGWTDEQVGIELGIERSTVTKRLSKLGAAALSRVQEQQEYLAGLKYAQLTQLEYVISEAMDGWRKSKQPVRQVSKVQRTGLPEPRSNNVTPLFPTANGQTGNGQNENTGISRSREDITTRVAEQAGDTSFLREARAAMSDIRDILGLNAPRLLAPLPPGDGDEFSHLTDAEIDIRIANLMQAHSGMHVLSEDDEALDALDEDAPPTDEEDVA